MQLLVFFTLFFTFMAFAEEYVTVIDGEAQAVVGEVKPWPEGEKLTGRRIELAAVNKAQSMCRSKGMEWLRKGFKYEIFPPHPEEPKGYKITYLRCISYYSDSTKILLGLINVPSPEISEPTSTEAAVATEAQVDINTGLKPAKFQLSLGDCEELHSALLSFSPDKFITADLQGVFKEDASLKQALRDLGDQLHAHGWKLEETLSQMAVYRATMMEKMFADRLPVAVADPSQQAFNVSMRRGIDACLGTAWDENGIWAKAIATLPKKSVPITLCGRLKTLVQARQRIKIAEEKYEAAEASGDVTNKWLNVLGGNEFAAPLAVNVLDSAILAVIQSIINNAQPSLSIAMHPTVISALEALENSITLGISNDYEICGVKWPLREADLERSEDEKLIGSIASAYREYNAILELARQGKKKVFLVLTTRLVDLPGEEKDKYLQVEKASLLTELYKTSDNLLRDTNLDQETRNRLISEARHRIQEVIRAYSNTSGKAALMAKEWLEFLELPKGKS